MTTAFPDFVFSFDASSYFATGAAMLTILMAFLIPSLLWEAMRRMIGNGGE